MRRSATRLIALMLAVFAVSSALSDVTLPAIFSDHMVLQRDAAVSVWGWADAGEEISVSIGTQTATTKTGADGKWTVKLDKLRLAEPTTLTVKGANTITIEDVLVGEVWLCSGQSNMGLHVYQAENFEQEKAAAVHPQLRMFTDVSGAAMEPQERGKGSWRVCTPENVGPWSATAYFFGRDLYAKLGVPVGLVHSSVGGTPIEAWTSFEAQKDEPVVQPILANWERRLATWNPEQVRAKFEKQRAAWQTAADKAKAENRRPPVAQHAPVDPKFDAHRPAALFNGKIAPLIPYAIRGAIWYQGEANAHSVESGLAYRQQLPLLVGDWRRRWGQGDFPFAWVQLPEFQAGNSNGWCLVREAMLQSLKLPNTGMAVALGLGDVGNIHPVKKQGVGARLTAWALASVYGQPGAASGPLYASYKVRGSEIEITFTHADVGLAAQDGDLKGFVIAGADRVWKPAVARIAGGKLVISSPEVPAPVAVRYAWASVPEFNLVNGAGLPASPFRTDDWPFTQP